MKSCTVTVVITTKNRKECLCDSVGSALSQTVNAEILVIDDGSTDGTYELIRRQFPQVRIIYSEKSLGYIVQRNRAATLCQTPILISIDDDAVFSTPHVIEQTLRGFESPRVGAVAIPHIHINSSPEVCCKAPDAEKMYALYTYVGTAHALRRDLFLKLGGYREVLIHQSEEEDLCIRMLNAGYVTVAGCADSIHHLESPRRSWARMDYFGARNKVLYAWHNVPFPHLPKHLVATTILTAIFSLKPTRFLTRIRGVADAYRVIMTGKSKRHPVAPKTYELSRQLKKRGPLPLDEIEPDLPALPTLKLPLSHGAH